MADRQASPESTRIAVIGAGPAGLTAGHTLRKLGYKQVTIYEKEGMPGGKVLTDRTLGAPIELGALFATERYCVVLELVNEFGVQLRPSASNITILDEDGSLLTPLELALRKHGATAVKAALDRYRTLADTYRTNDRRGFSRLPAELSLPFAEYAVKFGILPLADMMRAAAVAYGFPYYENVPAMYYFKLFDVLPEVDPADPRARTLLFFPSGYQDLWLRVAERLDVLCSSEVTRVQRSATETGPRVEITAGDVTRAYDWLIIASPPWATQRYLDATGEERDLLGRVVSRSYHVTVARVAGMRDDRRGLMPYANTRPEAIGHANAWYAASPTQPVFAAYQNVDRSQGADGARRLLAQDFATLGGGTLEGLLLHKEWDNFPHVETPALEEGFYDRLEALQGVNGTLYAGGLMSFESVEHAARYARDLVVERFGAAGMPTAGSPSSSASVRWPGG